MELELYLAETAAHAERQAMILQEAKQRLSANGELTPLELSGAQHAIQVLVENSIGKAKQWLKTTHHAVPISAYEVFEMLFELNYIAQSDLDLWKKAVGLRNCIVHDYLNLDKRVIYQLLKTESYGFVVNFLKRDFLSVAL